MSTIIDAISGHVAFSYAAPAAVILGGGLALLHFVSIVIVLMRSRKGARPAAPVNLPAVSIVRPVCGLDHAAGATIASSFALDSPRYELNFCAARAHDEAVPLVRRLISCRPMIRAR